MVRSDRDQEPYDQPAWIDFAVAPLQESFADAGSGGEIHFLSILPPGAALPGNCDMAGNGLTEAADDQSCPFFLFHIFTL